MNKNIEEKRISNNYKSALYRHKNVEKVIKARRKKKDLLVAYKGGKCERCGIVSEISDIYDFHHIDPTQKEFGLAQKGKNLSLETCKKEVDKCQLLCRNCHAITHYELAQETRILKAKEFLEKHDVNTVL